VIDTARSQDDATSLRAFRAAARQVRNATIIGSGATVEFGASVTPAGEFLTRFKLLADEPFRSLAMSIRLVYMEGEPAHYYHICNTLYRLADPTIQERVKQCRAQYSAAINGRYVQFSLHGDFEGKVAGPKDVFDAWLYGVAFHQDPERRPLLEELGKYQGGAALPFAVHTVALRLSGPILDLDDVVADFLGEERVPRIGGGSPSPAVGPAA
jgi:hypothetical protein